MTLRAFITRFVRVPNEKTRRLGPLVLHPEQSRVVDAIDERDASGLRRYREVVLSWTKKSGKSTSLAAAAVWALAGDDLAGPDREVIVVSSDLAQSRDVVFNVAAKIVQRHPWLRSRCKVGATEIVYKELVKDKATSGSHTEAHVLRAVPRDIRGLHGTNHSCLICDEAWVHDDYDALEALAPSPSRRSPLTIYGSYAGLRSQQRAGVPWFDILARGAAGEPGLFLSTLSGPDAWREVPWITARWIDQMRRLYATCPSKYVRLVENRPAPADSGFLTAAEIQDALDVHLREPAAGVRGQRYVAALDIGLTFDLTALVLGHLDGSARFVVDVIRTWQGAPGRPVNLHSVEQEVFSLARRFPLARLVVDQWQSAALVQNFQRGGLPAKMITIAPATLDKLTTLMKGVFAQRQIRIPASAHLLIEQVEVLDVVETGARNRRRDLLRFDTAKGAKGAAAHDDLAICLALCLEAVGRDLGRLRLPEDFTRCIRAGYVRSHGACFLFGGAYFPSDPICESCEGWVWLKAAWRDYLAQGGAPCDLRTFRAEQVQDNTWVGAARLRQAWDALL